MLDDRRLDHSPRGVGSARGASIVVFPDNSDGSHKRRFPRRTLMHYVGRDWTEAEVKAFVVMYATDATMYDIGEVFGLRTGQVSTFASYLRNKLGMDIPRRDNKRKAAEAEGPKNRARVDFIVRENGRSYTVGGDAKPTLAWVGLLRRDGCKVEAIRVLP